MVRRPCGLVLGPFASTSLRLLPPEFGVSPSHVFLKLLLLYMLLKQDRFDFAYFQKLHRPCTIKNSSCLLCVAFLFNECVHMSMFTSESFEIFLLDNPQIFKSGAAGMYVLFTLWLCHKILMLAAVH